MLITDLSLPCATIDFRVEGIAIDSDHGSIALLFDDKEWYRLAKCTWNVKLTPGYHLLRAFVLDSKGCCIKQPSAYVEAEFYHEKRDSPSSRGFLFGQPSLCVLEPQIKKGNVLKLDYYVTNCEISTAAHGFQIRVNVDGNELGTFSEWKSLEVKDIETDKKEIEVRVCLVRPDGEEVKEPAYNVVNIVVPWN